MTIDRDFTPDPFDAEHCAVKLQFHFAKFPRVVPTPHGLFRSCVALRADFFQFKHASDAVVSMIFDRDLTGVGVLPLAVVAAGSSLEPSLADIVL